MIDHTARLINGGSTEELSMRKDAVTYSFSNCASWNCNAKIPKECGMKLQEVITTTSTDTSNQHAINTKLASSIPFNVPDEAWTIPYRESMREICTESCRDSNNVLRAIGCVFSLTYFVYHRYYGPPHLNINPGVLRTVSD
jgi:hypothetical protein